MIAVTGHLEREKVKRLAKELVSVMRGEGVAAELFGIGSKKLGKGEFSLVCVVGGDGSLLRVVRELKKRVPVLGIAAGKRSYLMQVKPGQLKKAVKGIVNKKYCIEKRIRLQGRTGGKKLPLALNELLVVPKKSGSLIECAVEIGKTKKAIEGDGLIIATPTGSSGHAYSAGGKKLGLGEKKFIVVPSNPPNREGRPFTVPDSGKIIVKPVGMGHKIEIVVDGRGRFKLGGKLLIEGGEKALVLRIKGLQ